jgi:mRNA interferase RelE/StbE
MVYTINFSKQSLKELEKINEPFYSNIKKAIIALSENPRPNGYKKLKGRNSSYRIRVGDYRIIYDIFDTDLVIDIITLGNRKDIYE